MKTLIPKRLLEPFSALLQQGLSRQSLAMTLAIGFVVATFPVFGGNHLPVHCCGGADGAKSGGYSGCELCGLPLAIRIVCAADSFWGVCFGDSSCISQSGRNGAYAVAPAIHLLETYGMAVGGACVVWLMLALPVIWILQKLILQFIPAGKAG